MLKVFLSYHHTARKTAAQLKSRLTGFCMDAFLAHEDLEPSTEWQKEILRKLRQCDVFIPLLTRSYHLSLWADQETGIAVALRKHVLPLKFSTDPYGFVGKLQALRANKDFDDTCWRIVHHLVSIPAFRRAVKNGVIDAFLSSSGFDESARLGSHLLRLGEFSGLELNRIVEGAANNHQIYGGWRAREAVRKLIVENRPQVREALARSFEKQAKSWGWS